MKNDDLKFLYYAHRRLMSSFANASSKGVAISNARALDDYYGNVFLAIDIKNGGGSYEKTVPLITDSGKLFAQITQGGPDHMEHLWLDLFKNK